MPSLCQNLTLAAPLIYSKGVGPFESSAWQVAQRTVAACTLEYEKGGDYVFYMKKGPAVGL